MSKPALLYVVVVGGFMVAIFLGLSNLERAAGAVMLTVGVLSVLSAVPLSSAQNSINSVTGRYIPNLWGEARPQLFILWGIGVAILGIAFLFHLA